MKVRRRERARGRFLVLCLDKEDGEVSARFFSDGKEGRRIEDVQRQNPNHRRIRSLNHPRAHPLFLRISILAIPNLSPYSPLLHNLPLPPHILRKPQRHLPLPLFLVLSCPFDTASIMIPLNLNRHRTPLQRFYQAPLIGPQTQIRAHARARGRRTILPEHLQKQLMARFERVVRVVDGEV